MKIASLSAHKILASDGSETIETTLLLGNGQTVSASVPAGISAGKYEVPKAPPDQAVAEVNSLSELISGSDWDQTSLDEKLQSSPISGNAALSISAALFKTTALPNTSWQPAILPLLFEGAAHGSPAITIQEFMVVESDINSARRDHEKIKQALAAKNLVTTVGAEGGFSPAGLDNVSVLNLIKEILPDKKIALDVASSFGLFRETTAVNLDSFLRHYPIVSVEDPFGDDDWDKWVDFTSRHGQNILVVGDDLTTTNPERISKALELKAINGVIIKPNQIGTISAAFAAVKIARSGGLKIIVSHRGGETDDTWIVDFGKAVQADYVKFGGLERGERIAKYNRLNEILQAP